MPVEVGLGVRNDELRTGLEEAKNLIEEFKEDYGGALSGYLAEAVSVGAISELGAAAVEYGSHLQALHEQYQVSTDDLQRFGQEAQKNEVSLDAVALAFNRMEVARSRALQGNEKDVESFARLNVTLDDLKNDSPEQIMLKIGASSMDAADMVQILGRNALALEPTLRKLADGSAEFGQVLDSKSIKALDEFSAVMKDLWNTAEVGIGWLESKALPVLELYSAAMAQYGRIIGEILSGDRAGAAKDIQAFLPETLVRYEVTKKKFEQEEAAPTGRSDDEDETSSSRRERPGETLREKDEVDSAGSLASRIEQLKLIQANLQAGIAQEPEQNSENAIKAKEEEQRITTEIAHLQAEADKEHEEAVKRAAKEKEESEKRAAALRAENDKREKELKIDAEQDPAAKRKLIEDELAAAQKEAEEKKKAYEAMPQGEDREKARRDYLEELEEVQRLKREDKDLDPKEKKPKVEKPEAPHFEEPDRFYSEGGRLTAGDVTNLGGHAQHEQKMEEHAKQTADDVHWIRQTFSQGNQSDDLSGF